MVNQTGGLVRIIKDGLALGSGASGVAHGTYNLNGGVLEIGGSNGLTAGGVGGGPGIFNLGGGKLKVIGSDLVTSVVPTLQTGTTSTIDTNGLNAMFGGGLAGTGGFTKTGRGALTLGGEMTLNADSSAQGNLVIGSGAIDGTLNIEDGVRLTVASVTGQTGASAVSNLIVGTNGADGFLNINGGAIVLSIASGGSTNRVQIGLDGGTGEGVMTGGSITVQAVSSYGAFDLGRGTGAKGTFTQSGGVVNLGAGALQIGVASGEGTYRIQDDAEVRLSGSSTIYVGHTTGGQGLIEIEDAGRFTQGTTATPAGVLYLGAYGGTGKIHQKGADSVVSIVNSSPVRLGYSTDDYPLGGVGTYQLDNGTLTMGSSNAGGVRLGEYTDTTGEFIQNGGTSQFVLNNVYVGRQGTGLFTVNNGTATIDKALVIGQLAGSNGTVNLNGGVLEVGGTNGIAQGAGTATVNLGGGTIKVVNSNLTTSVVPSLKAGTTSTINTNGLNATFSGGFGGTGGFAKTGRGALTLGGATTLNADSSVQGDLIIGSDGVDGSLNIENGVALTINSVSGQTGANAISRLIVGTAGREGTLNVNGGALTINIASGSSTNRLQIGLNGGTGVGTMTSGSISFEPGSGTYGAFDLGRGTSAKGTFTQSGGTVDLKGGALQIGVEKGDGTYRVQNDAKLLLSGSSTLYVGHDVGGNGLIEIENAGQFIQGTTAANAGQAYIGAYGATGKIHQKGAGSVASIVTINPVHIGFSDGSAGTYQLDNGTLTMGGGGGVTGGVRIAESANATGEFLQNNGTSRFVTNNVWVGYGGEGTFTLNAGTATVDKALVVGQLSGSNGTVNLNGGVLEVGGTNGIAKGAGTAAVNLGGGTIRVINSDLTTSVGMSLAADTTSTIDTNARNATFTGVLYGGGSLTKTGNGRLTITANNAYTGETRVIGGTLAVSGSLASSSLTTVTTGGTLTGSGTVGALNVASGGLLSPGNSPGILSAGDTIWGGGGSYLWELNGAIGTAGVNWDLLDVGGTLSLTGTSGNAFTVRLVSLDAANAPGLVADFDPYQSYSWIIASASQAIGDFNADGIVVDASGFLNVPDSGRFTTSVSEDGRSVVLTYSAVPEPATYGVALGVGLLLLVARRRMARSATK